MDEIYIRNNAESYGVPIIREASHSLLIDIVKKHNPQQILEIGTAVGYSGIAMLKSGTGKLTTVDHDRKRLEEAKINFADAHLENRVQIIEDDCLVTIAQMVADDNYNNFYDFIFLDGPKAQYNHMLEGLIMLLKPGGIILADNVTFRGYVNNPQLAPTKRYKTIVERLKVFIDKFINHPDLVNTRLIQLEDGLLYGEKRK